MELLAVAEEGGTSGRRTMSYSWLPLEDVLALEPYAAAHGVSAVARGSKGFVRAYERAGGKIWNMEEFWPKKRENFIRRHKAQMLNAREPGWVDGAPTRRTLALAMWAYSSNPDRLRRWVAEQPKQNPRPIPLDREKLLAAARSLGEQAHQTIEHEDRLFAKGWVLGHYHIDTTDVAGNPHRIGIWLVTRPTRGWFDGITGLFSRNTDRIMIEVPVDEFKDFDMMLQHTGSSDWGEVNLMHTLLHEFTHARDVYAKTESAQQSLIRKRRDTPEDDEDEEKKSVREKEWRVSYLNQPIEVRARMQELADLAVRSIPEIMRTYRKANRPPIPATQWVLEQMALWQEIEEDLTPASKKKIMLGVERTLRDAGLNDIEVTSDIEDAVEYYVTSFITEPDGKICFEASQKTMPLQNILQWDDYSSWGEIKPGDLVGMSKEEIASELKSYRGAEWAKMAMQWVESGVFPPITLISGKASSAMADGRGRVNIAVGLDLKAMDVIILTESDKGAMCFEYEDWTIRKTGRRKAPSKNPSRRKTWADYVTGEYWILEDGTLIGADGTMDTAGHERYAVNAMVDKNILARRAAERGLLAGKIGSSWDAVDVLYNVDEWTGLDNYLNRVPRDVGIEAAGGEEIWDELVEDARIAFEKHRNAIGVNGVTFGVWRLDEGTIRRIRDFLLGQLGDNISIPDTGTMADVHEDSTGKGEYISLRDLMSAKSRRDIIKGRGNPSRKLPVSELIPVKVVEGGKVFETGQPVTFRTIRNTQPAPNLGSKFQQDIEPAGRYLQHLDWDPGDRPANQGWEFGEITLESPLVISFTTDGPDSPTLYGPGSWKARLNKVFKAKGCALTKAIRAAGYDAVVTVWVQGGVPGGTREIVLLPEKCDNRRRR